MNGTSGRGASEGIDRRTFLFSSPRRLLKDISALWGDIPPHGREPDPPSGNRRIAVLDISRCLAWGAGECQACYLQCPLRDAAIVSNDGKPTVVASACDGCGVCVEVCHTVNDLGAIQIVNI